MTKPQKGEKKKKLVLDIFLNVGKTIMTPNKKLQVSFSCQDRAIITLAASSRRNKKHCRCWQGLIYGLGFLLIFNHPSAKNTSINFLVLTHPGCQLSYAMHLHHSFLQPPSTETQFEHPELQFRLFKLFQFRRTTQSWNNNLRDSFSFRPDTISFARA